MTDALEAIRALLGLDVEPRDLTILQVSLRALLIFLATIVTVRVGQKRFFGRNTAMDIILAIMLGSVASRAINGSAPFLPTVVAGFVLVGMHWVLSFLSFHSSAFGKLVKGNATLLIQNGELQADAMRKLLVTRDDLDEDLRSAGSTDDPASVKEARMERSGALSVIPKRSSPEILEVRVENGVQVIRIELS
ncbi:DUF421 domain-containing protein [Deinococcus peraridilitoris]|uniref:Putative membrane protein n=1 Tax=Deinococcus peraridilitoris (strain DSM 19664 / LMG 22246 / CIP 109416 / KR-200) TaxID=937777 RepID=L0A2K6_DEIPD|nr:YetF domain-containing protein [Deinococcus peraridilitoris]AFZ67432.1 putative membrane protein [Deinococcus peraridilitoris DSM 19664]